MQTKRHLRIVVASPSDVRAERDRMQSVIDELNRGIAADRDLTLGLTRWETDAHPGFHAQGPQGLIDPVLQITDCDLLIGIFWKRFGTPTADGQTGTEHEINTAIEAWKENGTPQIFVYFNQKPHTPTSKRETDQWGRVLEFREKFPPEGLWWNYDGEDQFERQVRVHLTNFLRSQFPNPNQTQTQTARSTPSRTVDDLLAGYRTNLIEKIGKVRLLGDTQSRPLEKVFVELAINETSNRPTANAEFLGMLNVEMRRRYNPFSYWDEETPKKSKRINPDDLLKRNRPSVIAGAPGCGKTTLMRWLALQLCHETSLRIPVFLELKNVSHKSVERTDWQLESLLFEAAIAPLLEKAEATAAERELLNHEFLKQIQSGNVVVLLDGLDEVRGWQQFPRLCNAINGFIEDKDQGKNLLILSSRPFALRDRPISNAEEMEIAPFDHNKIELFLDHYYPGEQQQLMPRLKQPELADLVSVPVLLGAVVRRIRESGAVETSRLKLYEAIVTDLAGKIDQEKGDQKFKLDDHDGRRRLAFLTQMAFDQMFDDEVEQDAERLTFTADAIETAAQHFCAKLPIDPFDLTADIKVTPLLREVAENVWAFSHLTLQEYLAAKALAMHQDVERLLCRAYFNPTLAEMEVLPMALGMARQPDRLLTALEQLPESLDYKNLRLRARGLMGGKVKGPPLQNLADRFDQLLAGGKRLEEVYFYLIVRAFAQSCGESHDAIVKRADARLSLHNGPDVRRKAVEALTSIGGNGTEKALLQALFSDPDSSIRGRLVEALLSIGSDTAVESLPQFLLAGIPPSYTRYRVGEMQKIASHERAMVRLQILINEADSSFRSRGSATEPPGRSDSDHVIDRLLQILLNDAESSLRGSAAEVLGHTGGERAVDGLHYALLNDLKPSVHWRAAEALGIIGSDRAVEALLQALINASDSRIRWSAASALRNTRCEIAVASLHQTLLSDTCAAVRCRAALALGTIGSERAVGALLQALLNDVEYDVRWHAANTLHRIDGKHTEDILIQALIDDADSYIRCNAAEALGRIGSERAVDALLQALRSDAEPDVRWRAAEALGRIGSERAVDALLQALLDDVDSDVRWSAAEALDRIGSERAVNALLWALLNDAESSVRRSAAGALDRIGSECAVDALLQALTSDAESDVRWRAALALGRIGSERAIDALLQALTSDAEPGVRGYAAEALGSIGSERAVDALLQALTSDAKPNVRWRAGNALGSIRAERAVDTLLQAMLNNAESDVRQQAANALEHRSSNRFRADKSNVCNN